MGCVKFLSHIINQRECVFLVNEDVTSIDRRTRLRYDTISHTRLLLQAVLILNSRGEKSQAELVKYIKLLHITEGN